MSLDLLQLDQNNEYWNDPNINDEEEQVRNIRKVSSRFFLVFTFNFNFYFMFSIFIAINIIYQQIILSCFLLYFAKELISNIIISRNFFLIFFLRNFVLLSSWFFKFYCNFFFFFLLNNIFFITGTLIYWFLIDTSTIFSLYF